MRCPDAVTRRDGVPQPTRELIFWVVVLVAFAGQSCKSSNPVTVCAVPSPPDDRAAQLNPTWERLDENGVPWSPRWNVQTATADQPLCVPDPDADEVCGKFPKSGGVPMGDPRCNSLAKEEAPAADIAHGLVCSLGRGVDIFAGHLNFMPASYEGLLWFQNHAWPDDDIDFDMLPLERGDGVWRLQRHGLTTQRRIEEGLISDPAVESTLRTKGLDYVLHVEAKASESVDQFSEDWWDRFRRGSKSERKSMVQGRPAVVTGLLGLDVEHGAFTEIHPAHVVAVQTSCGNPVQGEPGTFIDTWSFFIRNNGNLGWCSQWSLQHMLDPVSRTLTLALPAAFSGRMAAAELVADGTTVLASAPGVERSGLELEEERLLVRFRWSTDLPEDEWLRIHGQLSVRWEAQDGASHCLDLEAALSQSLTDPIAAGEQPGPPEERADYAEHLLEQLYGERPASLTVRSINERDRESVVEAEIPRVDLPPGEGPCPGGAGTCDPDLRAVLADRPASPPTPDVVELGFARPDLCDLAERAAEDRGMDVDRRRLEAIVKACQEQR